MYPGKTIFLCGITLWMVLSDLVTGDVQEAPLTKPETAAVDRLRAITDNFVLNFYHDLATSQGPNANIFFSPLSIYSALFMMYLGAKNQTRTELGTILALNSDELAQTSPEYFNRQFLKFITDIFTTGANVNGSYKLDFANRICLANGLTIQPAYNTLLDNFYNSNVQNYDFLQQPDESRLAINAWVSNVTRAKIPNLLPPGTVDSQTILLLANAIYFKSDWQFKFDPVATQEMKFLLNTASDENESDSQFRQVKMMTTKRRMFYSYDQEMKAQIVELPYHNEELSMVVVLPRSRSFAAMEQTEKVLSGAGGKKWQTVQDRMDIQMVELRLPKFRMETEYDLRAALGRMGAVHVLAGADLSGMLENATALGVSAAIHKAFVEVNEEGTEAAAATGIVFSRSAMVPDNVKEVTCDHPFLFAIRHNPTNLILFMGRVTDPSVSN